MPDDTLPEVVLCGGKRTPFGDFGQSLKDILGAGLPEESRALDVSRACGSGTQAIVSAAEQIMTGHSSVALAGGYENASRAPYAVTGARWGMKRGAGEMVDTIDYGYRDPFDLSLMGDTAENLTDDFGYGRTDMDLYAVESQHRAGKAVESGFLAEQIAGASDFSVGSC